MTLYYWEKEIHQAPKIHSLTKIPIRTIYYNIKKSEKKERKAQRGKWPQKSITGADARRISSTVLTLILLKTFGIQLKQMQRGANLKTVGNWNGYD